MRQRNHTKLKCRERWVEGEGDGGRGREGERWTKAGTERLR